MPRKRTYEIKIRLDEGEYAEYQKRLAKSGLTGNSYAIRCLLDKPLTIIEDLGDITRQLRGIATNINELARYAHKGGKIEEHYTIVKEGGEVIWQLLRRLGAVPAAKDWEKRLTMRLTEKKKNTTETTGNTSPEA